MDEYVQTLNAAAETTQVDTDVAGEYTCTLASETTITFTVTGDNDA